MQFIEDFIDIDLLLNYAHCNIIFNILNYRNRIDTERSYYDIYSSESRSFVFVLGYVYQTFSNDWFMKREAEFIPDKI